MIEDMHMHYADTIEEAFKKAKELLGKEEFSVTAIPDGVSVIVN